MAWAVRYFTGTGGSERAAKLAATLLSTEAVSIEDERAREIPEGASLLLVFPVYSWAPPAIVSRYMRRLPAGAGRTAAVLAVDGGDGRGAAGRASRALGRRGWKVRASGRAGYVVNWRQMAHVPSPERAREMAEAGDGATAAFVKDLLEGRSGFYRPAGWNPFMDALLPALFPLFARRILGKLWFADADCDSCRRCAASCPAGVILMGKGRRAKPFWKGNCENCGRCVNVCPRKAIVTSIGRGLAINLLPIPLTAWGIVLWNGLASRLAPALPGPALIAVDILAWVLIYAAAAILVAGPLDRFVLRYLQRLPGLRAFMGWTFNKGWDTRLEPGFRPPVGKGRGRASP